MLASKCLSLPIQRNSLMRLNNVMQTMTLQKFCAPSRASMIGFDIAQIQHTGRARSGKTQAEILRREKSIIDKWQAASSYCPRSIMSLSGDLKPSHSHRLRLRIAHQSLTWLLMLTTNCHSFPAPRNALIKLNNVVTITDYPEILCTLKGTCVIVCRHCKNIDSTQKERARKKGGRP